MKEDVHFEPREPVVVHIVVDGKDPAAAALHILETLTRKFGDQGSAIVEVDLGEEMTGVIALIQDDGFMSFFESHEDKRMEMVAFEGSTKSLVLTERRLLTNLICASLNSLGQDSSEGKIYRLGSVGGSKLEAQVSTAGPAPYRSALMLRQNAKRYRGKKSKGR